MTHDDVRAALVSDEPVPAEAREHLARCAACLAFARGLDRVRRGAPLLVPAGAPAGLADRVVAAVADPPVAPVAPVAPVVPLSPARTFGRRALVRVAVGVAATLVVAAAAVALRPERERTPRLALAAAARRTVAAGTARVAVEGTTTFVLPVADRRTRPEFESMPDALRAEVEEQWRALVEAFERALARYEEQINDAIDRIDDALDGVVPTNVPVPRLPRLPRVPTPSPPTLPPSLTTTVTVRAAGDVSFTERLRLRGNVGVDGDAAFDLLAWQDGVAVRAEGRPWAGADARVGPWGLVLGAPDDLLRMVQEATDVEPVDGTRRYRFRIRTLDGTALAGEADVDADGRLSGVRLTASGRTGGLLGATWATDVRVGFSDPGVRVEPVEAVRVRERVDQPDDASRPIYPLDAGVRAAVE